MSVNNFQFVFVSKQTLLYIATVVWAFAGSMLLFRGSTGVFEFPTFYILKIIIAIVFGLLFYILLFRKISKKHILRIRNISEKKVPFYAFFNLKSYIMMFSMILLGVFIRKSGLVPFEYLAVFYICMGLPLFISSIRFLYHAKCFNKNLF